MNTDCVSIIIVTYKRNDLLAQCLQSVRRACGDAPQIVVVDNAAEHEACITTAAFPNTSYVKAPSNLGFAGGNNLGLAASHGSIILLLNNDTILHDDPLPALLSHLDSNPRAAAVQGRLVLPNLGGTLDDCGSFITPLGLQLHRYFNKPDPGTLRALPVFSVKGACLMFRRSVLPEVGGFLFHDHFGSYYEETDFCHRIWLAGHEVHFVPSPPIQHLMGQTAGAFPYAAIRKQYISNILFSFLTLFSRRSLFSILPGYATLLFLDVVKNLLTFNIDSARAPLSALPLLWRRRRDVAAFRKTAQRFRKKTDRELLPAIQRKVSWRYYWLTATGRIEHYTGPWE